MAIQNPCEGEGRMPLAYRKTSQDLGTKFGGRRTGKCPENGCDARVLRNGRLAKHTVDPGRFDLMESYSR